MEKVKVLQTKQYAYKFNSLGKEHGGVIPTRIVKDVDTHMDSTCSIKEIHVCEALWAAQWSSVTGCVESGI